MPDNKLFSVIMLRSAVVFVALLVFVSGQSTTVNNCVVHDGEVPINVYVENCETPPCLLPQLSDAKLNVVFRAPRTMRSMRTLAAAYLTIFGVTSPVGIPHDLQENSVTCNFLENTYCPLIKDEIVLYSLTMYIEPLFFVGTAAFVEFYIQDENGDSVICFRLSIRITDPLTADTVKRIN